MKGNYKLAEYGKVDLGSMQEADTIDGILCGGIGLGIVGVPFAFIGGFFGGLITNQYFPGSSSPTEGMERLLNFKGCSVGAGWADRMADWAIYTETGIIAAGAIIGYKAEK